MDQKNRCLYCNKELFGVSSCDCKESLKGKILWNKNERLNKKRKDKK